TLPGDDGGNLASLGDAFGDPQHHAAHERDPHRFRRSLANSFLYRREMNEVKWDRLRSESIEDHPQVRHFLLRTLTGKRRAVEVNRFQADAALHRVPAGHWGVDTAREQEECTTAA